MSSDQRSVLIAYDGSAESRSAVSAAVMFFRGYRLYVVTVWEPGLAALVATASGAALMSPHGAMAADVARVEDTQVADVARAGAELVQELGAAAEAIAITEASGVAAAIASEADRLDACAVTIGSRGLGRVRAPLLGSTSQALLRATARPVLVVRAPQ
jgi:nucleotide-binding universal stress UspA family protein